MGVKCTQINREKPKMKIQTKPTEFGTPDNNFNYRLAQDPEIAQSRAKSYSCRIAREKEIKSKVLCAAICTAMIGLTIGFVTYGMVTNPVYTPVEASTETVSTPEDDFVYVICGVEENDENGNLIVHMPNGELHKFIISDPPINDDGSIYKIEFVTLKVARANEDNYAMYQVVAID